MRLEPFRQMVRRLAHEIPSEYLDGIAAIEVSPRTLPHPVRADVYTLGECIPIHSDQHDVTSRIVLYHGSFQALARLQEQFDWVAEARETLLHEVRHHLEWMANTDALEAYDWAAEQNFARVEGRPFDPLFFQAGDVVDEGVYRVDDDVFLDRVVRRVPGEAEITWHGRRYRVVLQESAALPLYVTLEGLVGVSAGDVILVLRRKARLRDLWRAKAAPQQMRGHVQPVA